MTKNVRIENADMTEYKVNVFTELKNEQGVWVRSSELADTAKLYHPCQMANMTIWVGKRLVIEETQ